MRYAVICLSIVLLASLAYAKDRYQPEYSVANVESSVTYSFGVHPQRNLERLFEIYGPMVEYLNKVLSPDKIVLRLEASRDYPSYESKLYAGGFDFGLPNPYQAIISTDHGYTIFGKMDNDEEFRGLIVVPQNSEIREITDLRGKSISYPAATALAGTLLPQMYIQEHGVNVNTETRSQYVGTHDASFLSVAMGQTQAGAGSAARWERFREDWPAQAQGLVKAWMTDGLPSNALIVHDSLSKDVRDKVSKVFFSMPETEEGRKVLSNIPLARFVPASKETYEPVRKFIERFEKNVRKLSE